MKNLNPDLYSPNISLGIAYSLAAKELYKIQNRNYKFWIPAYYLMTHSIELTLKGYWEYENKTAWCKKTHNLSQIFTYIRDLDLSDSHKQVLVELDNLNSGDGGLRYENVREAEFLPFTFNDSVILLDAIIEKLQNRYILKDKTRQ